MNIAYLCDPEQIAGLKARGEHVENLLADLCRHAEPRDRGPAGRHGGQHASLPRQFPLHWVASGGYEPVAEVLFNQINADAYFMEYDSDRAGGFEPLRFVPRGHKVVVLGLVTSKSGDAGEQGRAEAADRRRRRSTCRSNSSRCRRNAASPAPRKATC